MVITTTLEGIRMTKSDSSDAKNRLILPVGIITSIVISGFFLANPVMSFVTPIQSPNTTAGAAVSLTKKAPKINGSTNVMEKTQDVKKKR
jgi:hypothetical protein